MVIAWRRMAGRRHRPRRGCRWCPAACVRTAGGVKVSPLPRTRPRPIHVQARHRGTHAPFPARARGRSRCRRSPRRPSRPGSPPVRAWRACRPSQSCATDAHIHHPDATDPRPIGAAPRTRPDQGARRWTRSGRRSRAGIDSNRHVHHLRAPPSFYRHPTHTGGRSGALSRSTVTALSDARRTHQEVLAAFRHPRHPRPPRPPPPERGIVDCGFTRRKELVDLTAPSGWPC